MADKPKIIPGAHPGRGPQCEECGEATVPQRREPGGDLFWMCPQCGWEPPEEERAAGGS